VHRELKNRTYDDGGHRDCTQPPGSQPSPHTFPTVQPPSPCLDQGRGRALGDVGVPLGGRAIGMAEQRGYDFPPGALGYVAVDMVTMVGKLPPGTCAPGGADVL
jgi:hypothetical protein